MTMIIYWDSLLVLSQNFGEYKCKYESFVQYFVMANKPLRLFFDLFFFSVF